MSHSEIKNKIDALEIYLGDEHINADVFFEVTNSLKKSFEAIVNSNWETEKELSDWLYNGNDPLDIDGSDDLPEVMCEDIRDIMIDIIREFSPE